MRYTVITGQYSGYPGYDFTHYIYPSNYHSQMIPHIWKPTYTVSGHHGIHNVYYFGRL